MKLSRTLLWSSALAGSVLLALGTTAGCSDDDGVVPNGDGGGSSSGGSSSGGSSSGNTSSSSGGDAGTAISIPQGATLRWTSKGGQPMEVGDASTCDPSDDLYTYELGTKKLTWRLCQSLPAVPEQPLVFAYAEGTVVLDAERDGAVQTALGGVVPNPTLTCGNDKPNVALVVVAPDDAETTYLDQFYHCVDDGKNYVDGLDDVGSAFAAAVVPLE